MRYIFTLLSLCILLQLSAQRLVPLIGDGGDIKERLHGPDREIYDLASAEGQLWMAGKVAGVSTVNGISSLIWTFNGAEYNAPDYPAFTDGSLSDRAYRILETAGGLIVGGKFSGSGDVHGYFDGVWNDLGAATDGEIFDLAMMGDDLFIVGDFNTLNGENTGNVVAKWDGQNWEVISGVINGAVNACAVLEDTFIIGGEFTSIGGETHNYIAAYDGESWVALDSGFDSIVYDLEVYNGELVVSGTFSGSGDGTQELPQLVKWDGNTFVAFSTMMPQFVGTQVISVVDDLLITSVATGSTSNSFEYDGLGWTPMSGFYTLGAEAFDGKLVLAGELSELEPNLYFESFLFAFDRSASAGNYLSNQNLSAFVTADANSFSGPQYQAAYYTMNDGTDPFEPLVATIYSSGLWYSGLENDVVFVGASQYYDEIDGSEFRSVNFGPISDGYDQEYLDRYYGVWFISAAEVAYHQQHYNDFGYIPSTVISSYPANGRPEYGESTHLLPFVDVNENGWYEPLEGDYPLLRGDISAFRILSDMRFGQPYDKAGVEMVIECYCYTDQPTTAFTIFSHAEIRNRSERDYSTFKVGVWTDGDIGSGVDDYVGCSPEDNYYYFFNGDAFDEPGLGSPGYGADPPAQAVVFFDRPMSNFMFYNNSNSPISGEPQSNVDFHGYMNSRWKNGQQLLFGGDGANEGTGADPNNPVQHMFPDFPWESGDGIWHEIAAGNPPSDRRGIGAFEGFEFPSGAVECVDYAYVTAFPEGDEEWGGVIALAERVPEVVALYNDLDFACEWTQFPLNAPEISELSGLLQIYPNPAMTEFTISGNLEAGQSILIYDITGKLVIQSRAAGATNRIEISSLNEGIYLVAIPDLNVTRKLVVR